MELTRMTAAELSAALAEARSPRPRSPRRTWTGSPPWTTACTPSCTSRRTARWPRPRDVDKRRRTGEQLAPLAGVPVAVKDVFTTIGMPTTCGSRILDGWHPPYDATITQRLKQAGAIILGKTNMDEFAMGSSTENSAFGPSRNPWDLDRIPGGSSGGSAAAVAAYEAPLAIGTDTGGSIRQPAAVCGIVGTKPTYGGSSRYGVVAFASSLDTPGPFGRTVLDAALLHEAISGHDPMDSTSIDAPVPPVVAAAREADVSGMRIGVVTELSGDGYQPGVLSRFAEAVELLESLGAKVTEVSCPHFKYALPAYYLIAPSEVSSNLARFDAMRYGLRVGDDGTRDAEEVMALTREEGFGAEVKRRIILGTYALSSGYYDAYYGKAQKVRTLIIRDFDAAFGQVDVLVSPSTPTTAFPLGERADDPMAMYLADLCTIPSDLAGNAAISVPCGLARRRRAAGRAAGDGARAGRRPAVPGRRRRGSGLHRPLGPAAAHQREGAGSMTMTMDTLVPFAEAVRALRAADRAGDPRGAGHQDQDVLRLPDHLRGRAEQPGLPGLPGPARLAAGGEPDGDRVHDQDRPGPELLDRDLVPVRAEELLLPGHAEELPDLPVRRAAVHGRLAGRRGRRADRSGSGSSGCTWKRTPASRCTWAGPPAGSTAPSTRSSTTTGPASRWWRS